MTLKHYNLVALKYIYPAPIVKFTQNLKLDVEWKKEWIKFVLKLYWWNFKPFLFCTLLVSTEPFWNNLDTKEQKLLKNINIALIWENGCTIKNRKA